MTLLPISVTARGRARSSLFLSLILGAGLLAACSGDDAERAPSLRGFAPAAAAAQVAYEDQLVQRISPERIGEHLEFLTSRLHTAGTEGGRVTAQYVHDQLVEYGWDAEIIRYDAWLTLPVETSIELVAPQHETIPTTEQIVPGDPFTQDAAQHPGWNGYSASGDVTAPVVYAHHGSDEDFRKLLAMGVDPAGKIVLLRYFSTGEGHKVYNAQKYGAVGVILYADPEEDGFVQGDVYPEGNWRPPGAIMRRSVVFEPYTGDPLSPGFASVPGVERLDPTAVHLPTIPVVPTSYAGAERLLETLGGPEAPDDWQGGLLLTYRLGGGESRVRVRAVMDNGDKPILNVVARLEGERSPDQWVIAGNHHDAWIYGAGDPSSGTAAVLEWARVVGELAAEGQPPARTLVLGVWDAEEMLLGGSTEWVEDHTDELLEHAVANINMDSAVFNPDRPLRVASHAALHEVFREVASMLEDPRSGDNFAEHWAAQQRDTFALGSVDGFGYFYDGGEIDRPWIFEVPSDDAAPFMRYLALPASDMYYGGDYGMYHSLYENLHWMRTVVDPGFGYHALMARLQALVVVRLANADVLPLEYATEATFWRLAYRDLQEDAAARDQQVPGLEEAQGLIDEWEIEARGLAEDITTRLRVSAPAPATLERINVLIQRLPQDFYRAEGSPARPWNKNLFVGSAYDFEEASGSLLPGLRYALDEGNDELAVSEARIYTEALARRVENLQALRSAVDALQ